MINPQLGYVLLYVKDPIASADFYTKLFGIKPVELSKAFALYALKNQVMFGLWEINDVKPAATASAGASEICFNEEHVDELYEKMLSMGIPMAQKPTDMDFGRTFVALDPDGHRIRICKITKQR